MSCERLCNWVRGKDEVTEAGGEDEEEGGGGRSEVSEVNTSSTSRSRENLERRDTVDSKAKE